MKHFSCGKKEIELDWASRTQQRTQQQYNGVHGEIYSLATKKGCVQIILSSNGLVQITLIV